jgi:hypothetical protein
MIVRAQPRQLGFALPAAVATGAAGGPVGIAISAGIAAVSLVIGLIRSRKGPQQKVATTQIVNQLEPVLQENLASYLAGPRTVVDLQAALANFDSAWAWLVSSQACGNIVELGDPGRRCIEDRNHGGQFDWFRAYRDPIATDQPVTTTVTSLVSSVTSSGSGILLLAVACLVMGVLL